MKRTHLALSALAACLAPGPGATLPASAALPKPPLTPAQQQAAAAKKAEADARAAKEKGSAGCIDGCGQCALAQPRSWPGLEGERAGGHRGPGGGNARRSGRAVRRAGTSRPSQRRDATRQRGAGRGDTRHAGRRCGGERPAAPGVTPPSAGVRAAAPAGAAPGTSAAAPGRGAAPRSPEALNAANVPIKSEKMGTAAPSDDVKKGPTKAVPKGASPAVDKGNADNAKSR
ncbi:hypothetical protein [Massilia sp. Se16.2.3]|uniref:hypothetical protein n=1 Tax=Massilia sp. Se16.2.3 TaxID=2709303 RepID=UPI001E5F9962|nr:hypothetical protein [Massilia sp. Se16.2.3]